MFCESKHWMPSAILGTPESAIGADLKAQRSANPITLRDGHGSDFVTVTRQILMAVHTHESREANIMKCQAMTPQPPK
jgi:hypothetical protein